MHKLNVLGLLAIGKIILQNTAQYFYISAFIDRADQVLSSVDLTKKKASGTTEMLNYAEYIKDNLELFITGQDYNQIGVCDKSEDKVLRFITG
jgi:hypothetical protein